MCIRDSHCGESTMELPSRGALSHALWHELIPLWRTHQGPCKQVPCHPRITKRRGARIGYNAAVSRSSGYVPGSLPAPSCILKHTHDSNGVPRVETNAAFPVRTRFCLNLRHNRPDCSLTVSAS